MKKLTFAKALFAALSLTLALPGCSDFEGSDSASQVQTQGNKIALRISAGNGYGRMALPDESEIKLAEYKYDLSVISDGEKTSLLKKGPVSYSELISENSIYIEEGTYNFILEAYDEDEVILAGSLAEVKISETDNSLSFRLFAVSSEDLTANVSIDVELPAGYGANCIIAKLYPVAEGEASTKILLHPENDSERDAFALTTVEGDVSKLTTSISASIPAGQGRLLLIAHDEDDNEIGRDLLTVYAVKGITSYDKRSIPLTSYKATVNVITDAVSPVITLKNKKIPAAQAIKLVTKSTESPFTFSGYVPMGEYDVFVNDDAHGSLTNASPLNVDTDLTLQSISAEWKNESQPTFYVGDDEDNILAALSVKGLYKDSNNNEKTQEIPSGYSLSGYDPSSKELSQTVKVTYAGKESEEFTVNLTAITVESIVIKNTPAKKVYKTGDELDLTGLVITLTMNNGKSGGDIAYSEANKDDFAVSGFSTDELAKELSVTITYAGISTATASFKIQVIQVAGIEIISLPTKTVYKNGEELDLEGLKVNAFYTDGEDSGLYPTDVTSQVKVSRYNKNKDGKQELLVEYSENVCIVNKTFDVTVLHVFSQTMTLDFTADGKAASEWNKVPVTSTQGSALVSRSDSSYTGYLGKKFWLCDGLYAEYRSGLGYTNSEKDSTHDSTDFVKALESEAISGPFELSVTEATNKAGRTFKIYVSSSKDNLWNEENCKLSEALGAKTHTLSYSESGDVYIGIGTLPGDDKTVYTSLQKILLKSDVAIPEDVFPATGIAFTNSQIENGQLTLTKDSIAQEGFLLTALVTPSYASDKSISYSISGNTSVSVSETGLVTVDPSMSANETVTITAKANGASDVSTTLTLSVKAVADDTDQVAQTKNELLSALGTFAYGNTAVVVDNANALIDATSFTYTEVEVTPSVNAETGLLTFTIKKGQVSESVTVEYTESLAKAQVAETVNAIKALSAFAWKTDAASTKTALDEAISSINTADVTVSTVTGKNSDGLETVTVTVANKIIQSVSDSSLVLEAPRFEIVADGTKSYLMLKAKSYTYSLKKENLTEKTGENAWSAVSADNWSDKTGTEVFKEKISAFNMSQTTRTITLNVQNVYSADLYVYGNTKDRNFTVKVGSGNAKTFTHKGSGDEKFSFETGTLDKVTITLAGNGESVYPLGIILYAPDGEASSVDVGTNLPKSDIILAADTENGNKFIVSGEPVTSGATITWYVDDVAQTSGISAGLVEGDTFTLSGIAGRTYEVRVDVELNGIIYSQSKSVMYQ